MSVQRRRFTEEDKLKILQQADKLGITPVLRKHKLSYSVFYRWKQQLSTTTQTTIRSPYTKVKTGIKNLVEENKILKQIIANQALELELKKKQLSRKR